ncbi:NAD-dependent epimerase/dehydratase family protein [Streptomyces avidinii]|nr:NAD-dependent epimerase/dehydratase family protein [Streptomyces avidinii]
MNADLADEQSLRGVCEGADVLLSLASYIGPDADRCAAVNSAGAAALVAEARRAGVGRIVHLSTCAVYGPGPHRGQDVGELAPAPVSPASAGRLAGEGPVLDAGGLVLRAGLVLGRGDRWPWRRCLDTLATVPGWVSERQFTLLARDHWYRADAAWELAGITLGPGPLSRIGPAAEWYRERGGAAPG